ncbi:MAG: glycosyltransferase family 4 protein [Ignavibacteriales bacterium]|nr:glycosyltransferase family 4 protein [Ignavibacteriales bacterium]
MKILLVNWRCIKNPEAGGAEYHLHEIFKRVIKSGHSATLVCHWFNGAARQEEIDGIKIIRIGDKFRFKSQFKKYYLKHLAKEDYDLIVDDISKIPMQISTYAKKPVVGILHHIHGNTLYKELPFPLAFYIIRQEKLITKFYSNTPIFVVSESTKKELMELGFPENKIDFLFNAITQESFPSSFPAKSPTPTITYVGRIKKYKNLEMIIDALPKVVQYIPDIKLEIAGGGDYLDKITEYSKKRNVSENIIIHGRVSENEKIKIFERAWIFITMSLKEGWSITVLEANAAYTPAIGADVPGLRDSIRNNKTGLLIENNADVLADTIIRLIKDKTRLKEFSINAKEWANNFTWEKSAEQFLRMVYEWYPQLKEK